MEKTWFPQVPVVALKMVKKTAVSAAIEEISCVGSATATSPTSDSPANYRRTAFSQMMSLCAAQLQMPRCAAEEEPASKAAVSASGGKIQENDTVEGSANATTLTVHITMAGTVMWKRKFVLFVIMTHVPKTLFPVKQNLRRAWGVCLRKVSLWEQLGRWRLRLQLWNYFLHGTKPAYLQWERVVSVWNMWMLPHIQRPDLWKPHFDTALRSHKENKRVNAPLADASCYFIWELKCKRNIFALIFTKKYKYTTNYKRVNAKIHFNIIFGVFNMFF